jgi:hypothetical protein
MTQVTLTKLVTIKPNSGIGFCTAYTYETNSRVPRVFTFEYEIAGDPLATVLEAVTEDAGYQVAGLY